MPMLSVRAGVVATVVLFVALIMGRYTIVQLLALAPLWTVSSIVGLVVYAIYSLDNERHRQAQAARDTVAGESLSFRRRALPKLAFPLSSESSDPSPRSTGKRLALYSSASDTFNSLVDEIMSLVRKHFITPWYARISPSPELPDKIDLLARHMLIEIIDRLGGVDWPTFMTSRILPIITTHMHHYRSVEHLSSALPESSTTPALPLPLPRRPHPALAQSGHTLTWASTDSIEAHLRNKLEQVVAVTLDDNDKSTVVQTLVREVLLGTVMKPVFEMLGDSDFWNRQIDEKVGRYLHEQKQVNRFLSALSSLPPPSGTPRRTKRTSSSISASSSTRQFEDFLRSISKVHSVGEARRLRSDIEREQRVAKAALEEASEVADDVRLKMTRKYVKRLERARTEVDHRITSLSGTKSHHPTVPPPLPEKSVTLFMVMSDPSSLAYWLEFMERRKRSHLVQFWLTVEGFKNPLEEDDALGLSSSLGSSSLKEDLAFLYAAYSESDMVPSTHLDIIRRAIEKDNTSPGSLARARQAMLAAQKEVYELMAERDWTPFTKTELYLKAAADLSRSSASPPVPTVTSLSSSSPTKPLFPAPRIKTTRSQSSFTPASVVTSAKVSTGLSPFERTMTEPRPSITRTLSDEGKLGSSLSSLPVTPPNPTTRRPSQLDILISPDENDTDRARLFNEEDNVEEDDFIQVERMEAIQAALNDIIASDDFATGREASSKEKTPDIELIKSPSSSLMLPSLSTETQPRLSSKSAEDLRAAQSLQSPTTMTPGGRRLFDDTMDDEQEEVILNDPSDVGYDSPRPAAPGDLRLSIEIAWLQDKITELVKREHLLENLVRQAELVGNSHELRILQRSLSSIRREQRTSVFQKAQYEQQEEENRLEPGRTTVQIPSSAITWDHGKQVVRYTIEIKQMGEDATLITGWMVARRYNDFWELDRVMREWSMRTGNPMPRAELPPKRLVTNMSSSFVDSRRLGLERYLRTLLSHAAACQSQPLQAFLSRDTVPLTTDSTPVVAPQNVVRSLYRTMATSLDEAILGPTMLDVMYTSLSRQLSDIGALVGKGGEDLSSMSLLVPYALKQGWQVPKPAQPMEGETAAGSFTAPICDLFIELFGLTENNWLRRQAIVVVLQQFLGGTVERRARDAFANLTSNAYLENLLVTFRDTLWPNGQRRPDSVPRTEAEKLETRVKASRKLGLLIPDVAANMIGKGNARRAARRVSGVLQDQRLNQHLVLCILDEIFDVILKRPP